MEDEIRRRDVRAPTGGPAPAASDPADFVRLVKLVGRAFYDDIGFNGDELTWNCSNNRGIAVVVLDKLTCYQWVIENNLSKALNIGKRKMARILQFFEEEKFLQRKKLKSSTGENIGRPVPTPEVDLVDEQIWRRCCCLDYPQIYDITRYKLKQMRERLKSQLDRTNTPPQYMCQNCQKRYSAFEIVKLPIDEDDNVQCNICYKVVAAVGVEERTELVAKMKKFEEQLKPMMLHLELMKNKPLPDFGYVHAEEGMNNGADMSRNTPRLSPRPVLGEATAGASSYCFDQEGLKIIPDWLIRQGMLFEEDTAMQVKHEYAKAYYEALQRKKEEDENIGPEAHVRRKIGLKSKRCDGNGDKNVAELDEKQPPEFSVSEELQEQYPGQAVRCTKRSSNWRDGD